MTTISRPFLSTRRLSFFPPPRPLTRRKASTFPGPTPAVSSSGTSNGIVWIIETDEYSNAGNAVLRAYNAGNLGSEIYNSQQNAGRDQAGQAVKFAVPTVADGHVFVGTVTS